jgi:arylsulfatase A-like enzyme
MKNISKLSLLIIPTSSLLYSCQTGKNEQQVTQPNIVFIMTDDHSFQTISAYGHPLSKLAPTPNIDRLASGGIVFDQAFVENSLSAPSRACLMTGLYSHQNGQERLGPGIDSTKTFFTEILQQNNYQTAIVGKWHLHCEPKGFDYYSILNDQGDYYNPSFRTKDTHGQYVRETGYATNLITTKSIEFLKNREKDKPFCLLVHHKAPHRNWMPEEKYLDLYEDVEFPTPSTFNDDYSTRCTPAHTQEMRIDKDLDLIYDLKVSELRETPPYNKKWSIDGFDKELKLMNSEQRARWNNAYKPKNEAFIKEMSEMTEEEIVNWKFQRYLKDYLRCIKSVDDEVGRIIDYLEEEGLMDNTIIVYTSDQGFYMGEHGWFDKRFMYEESLRTPLIMYYPKMIKAGARSNAMVQNIDYAPTFLSLAGVAKPEDMSGISIEPLFNGEKPEEWRNDLYYHYYDYPAWHQVNRHDGVRTERYKLIHFYEIDKDGKYQLDCNELYDLQADPNELNNLYGQAGYEDITADLQKRLNTYRNNLKVSEY